ncbi:hypothetical protein OHA21_52575 [Actinoplanes sp. NBC_00393]|uniref:hypothetical protein n=1 Tax=Actinoplanes sp. NBC_00393 TaxID=2975953 RepID=UPI002E1E08A9
MTTTTMPMLDTYPQDINLDRQKLAGTIDTLIAYSQACTACADECESHAGRHEHCRICAEACRVCEQACRDLLTVIS